MLGHITIYITGAFDLIRLMPCIKRGIGRTPIAYGYTLEKAYKLHIHLMLIVDSDDPQPLFDKAITSINKLTHVMRH